MNQPFNLFICIALKIQNANEFKIHHMIDRVTLIVVKKMGNLKLRIANIIIISAKITCDDYYTYLVLKNTLIVELNVRIL